MRFYDKPHYVPWHDWFAWYPVRAWDKVRQEYCWVWLETVQREMEYSIFSYRLKKKVEESTDWPGP